MITSDDIKESVIMKLLEIEPNIAVYKEATTKPVFPHFFVNQLTVSDSEERKNYHLLTYSIIIRYRVASDISTDLKLQQDLDEMCLKLLSNFNIITFNDSSVRCYDKMTEKVDGVLHFSFKIDLYAKYKDNQERIKMNNLISGIGVKK